MMDDNEKKQNCSAYGGKSVKFVHWNAGGKSILESIRNEISDVSRYSLLCIN